jgi:hypothetical protein
MWNALTSSSNFVLESLETFAESTGVAGLDSQHGVGQSDYDLCGLLSAVPGHQT